MIFTRVLPALALCAGFVTSPLVAQVVDTTRADTLRRVPPRPALLSARQLPGPPISPARAFLYSFAVPGWGQSRLDRGSAGALFATVELGALAMVRRTFAQVRDARRFQNDSLPTDFVVGPDGSLTPQSVGRGGFTSALVRRRQLHAEDWLALIAFNHLLSGADAFVSAQLWDLPAAVSITPTPSGGAAVAVSLRW